MSLISNHSVLELTSATKQFYGVTVLDNVDLDIYEGEIHALLGQNGSGKSTLIKILSGFHVPSEGTTLRIRGEDVRFPMHRDPTYFGLAFVHQNLGLADDMSILDNLSLGEYVVWHGVKIDWKAQRKIAQQQVQEFGIREFLDTEIEDLSSPAQKALIAIARAVTSIRRGDVSGVLVLDEPTVYLPRHEVEHLQAVVRRLAANGVGVLYVTHRLDELRGFADRATILRDGKKVGEIDASTADTGSLVEMITGSRIELTRDRLEAPESGPPILTVSDLVGARVQRVGFEARPGEILGLAGLVGMGQDEVLSMVFGATRRESGEIRVDGRIIDARPQAAIQSGIAFLPSDRPRRSGAMTETVGQNITLPVLRRLFFERGRINERLEAKHVDSVMALLDVRPRDASLELERLSGGNQQKALLGKWLQTNPKVLLLDEPVQGVDVGAKAQIFDRLKAIAADGCSVVIASSEYEDLSLLCDRVLIFVDGQISESLAGASVTKERIAAACFSSTDPMRGGSGRPSNG